MKCNLQMYLDFWKALAFTAKRYYHKKQNTGYSRWYRPRGTGNGSP